MIQFMERVNYLYEIQQSVDVSHYTFIIYSQQLIKMSANRQLSKLSRPNSKLKTQGNDTIPQTTIETMKQSSNLFNKGLATSDSKTTLGSVRNPEKRVRLRDYLFIAETSSARNNEKRKTIKQALVSHCQNPQTIKVQKKVKYQISNQELYKIVRKQIFNECTQITKNLCSKMEMLKQQNETTVQDEELFLLYDIQRILIDKVKPAMRDMNNVYYNHQKKVAQQMFALGRSLLEGQFSQEKKRCVDASEQSVIYSSQVLGHKN